MHATAKVPDKAWLLEIDRTKLNVRLQIDSRLLEKLMGREKPGDERGSDNGNCKISRNRYKSAVPEKICRVFRGEPASKQKRQQRKRRQRVMRQLGFDERENDENNRDAREKIFIDLILVVAGIGLSAVALAKADDPGLCWSP